MLNFIWIYLTGYILVSDELVDVSMVYINLKTKCFVFRRVKKLIDESKVYYGNTTDEDDLYISPTILKNVTPDDDIMKEEIFGPVLPLLTLNSVDEAIEFILDR